MVFDIRPNDYKYPIDNILEYNKYESKTKTELQEILNGLLLARFKVHFNNTISDLIDKQAILSLVMDLKSYTFDEENIRKPIPYFSAVLRRKHQEITGEEITETDIRKYEMEQIRKRLQE